MNIGIIGSTGSIGRTTVDIVLKHANEFKVSVLAAHSNISLIAKQAKILKPKLICIWDKEKASVLKDKLKGSGIKILSGSEGLTEVAVYHKVGRVVFALSGINGLCPLIEAIRAKKDIAIANKEVLVIAGNIIKKEVARNKVLFIPIDSEHSAIFQCIEGQNRKDISKIILTASGGPFVDTPKKDFSKITAAQALKHPKWSMGKKITIDSATMMNKGLEVIEAARLYDLDISKIDVSVHRQSIVHSLVEYCDGSMLAQLSATDMAFPIMYALSYPKRLESTYERLNLAQMGALTFEAPDLSKFPCLGLAYKAGGIGGSMTTVLNAANEVCVEQFLNEKIKFTDISKIISKVMDMHATVQNPNLNAILKINKWAREEAVALC